MLYAIAEIFYTLQGEGYHTGTPAIFVRFAGCSMWSGRPEHRERDALRHGAACPRFCDTDFMPRMTLALDELLDRASEAGPRAVPLIVLTGGEPLLQIDERLVSALRSRFPQAKVAIETNGCHPLPCAVDWVCMSPKVGADDIVLRHGDEIKVVVPAYNPADYSAVASGFTHRWVSAEARPTGLGESILVADNLSRAASWVLANPTWRLTVQTHKVLGIR